MSFQLIPGDVSVDTVVDRVVASVCAVVPGLPATACRDLVDLIFRSRVHQTTACGAFSQCRPPGGSLWGKQAIPAGNVPPAGWYDLDPQALPRMFALAAVGLMDLAVEDTATLEERLGSAFRRAVAPHLFANRNCGHATICKTTPTTPFARAGAAKLR